MQITKLFKTYLYLHAVLVTVRVRTVPGKSTDIKYLPAVIVHIMTFQLHVVDARSYREKICFLLKETDDKIKLDLAVQLQQITVLHSANRVGPVECEGHESARCQIPFTVGRLRHVEMPESLVLFERCELFPYVLYPGVETVQGIPVLVFINFAEPGRSVCLTWRTRCIPIDNILRIQSCACIDDVCCCRVIIIIIIIVILCSRDSHHRQTHIETRQLDLHGGQAC